MYITNDQMYVTNDQMYVTNDQVYVTNDQIYAANDQVYVTNEESCYLFNRVQSEKKTGSRTVTGSDDYFSAMSKEELVQENDRK